MIPRTLPKNKFVGESVAEASFIASKGIDETKAPTQRDTLANIKNLEVNYDGSLSPRKPIILDTILDPDLIYIGTIFTGDYLVLFPIIMDNVNCYEVHIFEKDTKTLKYQNQVIYNQDIKLINTASSTILQNCLLENDELATFKITKIISTGVTFQWKFDKMIIDINTLEMVDGVPRVNPNLMLSNPYSYRDTYKAKAEHPIGILPYIKGVMNNQTFEVDTVTNDTIDTSEDGLTIKELTESGNYKILESIPDMSFDFKNIYLKCFMDNVYNNNENIEYYIRWEKTTNGVYWEPASDLYENPESSAQIPEDALLLYVPSYVENTSLPSDDTGKVSCLFRKYEPVSENDFVINRKDVLIITKEEETNLTYSFRCLVYMFLKDSAENQDITVSDFELTNVDGETTFDFLDEIDHMPYYLPAYSQQRTTRTFTLHITINETLNDEDFVFSPEKFSCKVFARNSYTEANAFSEVASINATPLDPTSWSIVKDSSSAFHISGTIDISTDINTLSKTIVNFIYKTYVSVYYNNKRLCTDVFWDVIPVKNIVTLPTLSNLYCEVGTITHNYTTHGICYVSATYNNLMSRLKTSDSSNSGKLAKLPSSLQIRGTLAISLFTQAGFYTITTFTLKANYALKLESKSSSSSSYSSIRSLSKSSNDQTISSLVNPNMYNDLISCLDGSGIDYGKTYRVRILDASSNDVTSFTFTDREGFKTGLLTSTMNYYLAPVLKTTQKVALGDSDIVSILSPTASPTIIPVDTVLTNIYNGSSSMSISATNGLNNTNKYIYLRSTSWAAENFFQYNDIEDVHYYIGSAYDVSYFNNAYDKVMPNEYDINHLITYTGFPLNGVGTPYTFIRNYDTKISVLYLDLGCNDANKGYKLYWNHRIVSYGVFNNNILFSDSDSLITPLMNTLTLNTAQDTQITSIIPWRNYLIATTKEAVYLIYEMEGGFGHKAINTFIGIPEHDRRTCKAILNGIIFKSNNKIYTLQPGMYSNDDSVLNIAEISQPIESLLSRVENQEFNFAISTSKYYYLFLPGYPSGKTTCFKYDYVRKIWTSLEFPVVLFDYIQTTEDELYLVATDNKIFMFEKDFTEYVKNNGDTDNDDIRDADIPYGDYLESNVYTPINFVIDSGQKTDNISTTKQYVETKIIFATMDDMDNFPVDVDIYIDGIHFKQTHIDVNSDGAILKQEPLNDSLILGTNIVTKDSNLLNTFRQFILRYSGKGKSIRHFISGNSTYNFKLYVTYYRYKLTHNKQ